jgi:type IV pilus assembly protein PilV
MLHHASFEHSRQKGLTLVEILIAVLVISIGLLGVAGLHSFSLRNNYDALMRSHASALASDIADRMRANRRAALQTPSAYNIALTTSPAALTAASPTSDVDKSEWRATVASTLPQGLGQVNVNVGTSMATITIQWGERGELMPMQFVTETEI